MGIDIGRGQYHNGHEDSLYGIARPNTRSQDSPFHFMIAYSVYHTHQQPVWKTKQNVDSSTPSS